MKILENTGNIAALLALFGLTFEVIPIKINPISWLGNLINKNINDKIDALQKEVNDMKYKNDMKDLADIRNRIINYGLMIKKGEQIDCDAIKSIQHDLDMYDYYKETYKYMEINGRKVKINGEVETARKLIEEKALECKLKEGKKNETK